ncbi:MAG: exonuclease domain-containing protein [Clostridium sp.]|jgi:DNA polymerase III epsilon subunit-like protein|nr:exonuclease domain-containing protein [Clostridium sp.]
MNYIVFDLEWNQGGAEEEVPGLPFEVIEIGAVKLNSGLMMTDGFSQLVRPQAYHQLHPVTGRLLPIQMEELERGKLFPQVMREFLEWCGEEEYRFCTWGSMDLTEMQRNMKFYGMETLAEGPIPYLDVQKLFGLAYEPDTEKRSLEYAIDFLKVKKEVSFHRAYSDAYYTAEVLSSMGGKEVLGNLSYDIFHPPISKAGEIKIQSGHSMKYISRLFADKAEALADREVVSSKCHLCHRNLRKKVKWFTMNGRHYDCVAYCEKHGYLKGKIRICWYDGGKVYIVKTTKFITQEEAGVIAQRRNRAQERNQKGKSG